MLSIDGDIHHPNMELSPEDRRDRKKVNEAVRRYPESRVQHLNRIGRRIIMWMLLIAALAVIWNLLDERGRQLLSQCQVKAKSRWRVISR